MTIAGWLSDILGLHPRTDGVPRTPRRTVDFVGVDWTDNPITGIATWRIKVAEILARLSDADEPIDVNGQRIVDVGAPTTSTDAATKGYVDTAIVVASGTDVITAKLAVRARMPAQLTIPSTLVTDGGVTAAVDDRILLDQLTAPEDRGIYVAASGSTWLRASDFNDTADIAHGALILVVEGDDAGTLWQLDQIGSTIGGTDPLSFSQAGGGGSVFASIEVQDYAEVGTNVDPVAATGYLRMPFAGPHVTVRNFGNTADVEVLGTSGLVDNEVFLGDASVPLRLNGSTITVATSAHVSMGGYGFTSCARVENAGGGVDVVSDDIIVAAAVEARVTGPITNIATAAGNVLNAGNDTGATTVDGSTTTVKSAGNIALRPTGDTVDTLVCAVVSAECKLSSTKAIRIASSGGNVVLEGPAGAGCVVSGGSITVSASAGQLLCSASSNAHFYNSFCGIYNYIVTGLCELKGLDTLISLADGGAIETVTRTQAGYAARIERRYFYGSTSSTATLFLAGAFVPPVANGLITITWKIKGSTASGATGYMRLQVDTYRIAAGVMTALSSTVIATHSNLATAPTVVASTLTVGNTTLGLAVAAGDAVATRWEGYARVEYAAAA